MNRHRQDAGEIERMLAARIVNLAPELLPGGHREGPEWRCGSLAGEQGKSLSVRLTGAKAGIWADFATGERGDALDLIAAVNYRGDLRPALTWARRWLGLGDDQPAASLRVAPPVPPASPRQSLPAASTLPIAQAIWREAVPAANTLVEAYLNSRGLQLPGSTALRFHPRCRRGGEVLPAMVALMTDPAAGEPVGVHRTFLRPDGSGKADGQAKMMLGGAGIIRLVSDEEVTLGLGLAEGIETALSVMQHGRWSPVWAAGNAGAISSFPVLPGIECITVFADADEAGTKAARACAARWLHAGRDAVVHTPSRGDWNDIARAA